jgi:hypothetical protein
MGFYGIILYHNLTYSYKVKLMLNNKESRNKMTKKKKETINISGTWENILPEYFRIYNSLNEDGKKEVLRRAAALGKTVDVAVEFNKKSNLNKKKLKDLDDGTYYENQSNGVYDE